MLSSRVSFQGLNGLGILLSRGRFDSHLSEPGYLRQMLNGFDFCIPTRGISVPAGPDWLHEIKYDGYRLRIERNGDRVRLITRGGYDWTRRLTFLANARSDGGRLLG
jgi:hypothetical protein